MIMFDCIESTHSRITIKHDHYIERHRKTLMIILGIQAATIDFTCVWSVS